MPSATFMAASICSMNCWLGSRPISRSARRRRPVYVFLGDYIDRGPSSRETIDRLIEHGETNEFVFLKGNHELIAIKCLSDRSLFDQWLRLGRHGNPDIVRGASRNSWQTASKSLSCSRPFTAHCHKPIFAFSEICKNRSRAAISSSLMPG